MNDFFDKVDAKCAAVKSYCSGIVTDWGEGRIPRAVGKVILPLVPVALLAGVLALIWKYREAIMSGLIVLVTVFCIVGYCLDQRAERKNAEAERRERVRQEAIREKARTADATYTAMANVIWDVSRGLEPLGILSPNLLSDVYSSGARMIPKENGAVMLALFTIQKSGHTVDTDILKFTMQEKIDKKLTAGELPGIDPKKCYDGRVYSGFIIDAVVDRPGFVEVYAVQTDENYIRFKMDGELGQGAPPPSVDRRDVKY